MANLRNKILFVEDELILARIVTESLEQQDFVVSHAENIAHANRLYKTIQPNVIVADVMLPDGSGFDWIAKIRTTDTYIPVIFLTSRSQTADVIEGFEIGGNDYLKKPFSIAELIVRIKALLQRKETIGSHVNQKKKWCFGSYTFLYPAGELMHNDLLVKQLTSRESDILQMLLMAQEQPISRKEILQTFWNSTDYFAGRSLDVFVSKLRRYLKSDDRIKIINIRGVGYKLVY